TRLAVVELWDSVEPKAMAEVVAAHGARALELSGGGPNLVALRHIRGVYADRRRWTPIPRSTSHGGGSGGGRPVSVIEGKAAHRSLRAARYPPSRRDRTKPQWEVGQDARAVLQAGRAVTHGGLAGHGFVLAVPLTVPNAARLEQPEW
ncbi:hypothetical protein ACWCY1_27680, partial [Streptomyces goshikiensis]